MNIRFEGDCTVARAEELRETLLQALKTGEEEVTLSFNAVQGADLSFFQLLHAASRSFKAGGKKLVLDGDLPQDMHRAALCSGLPELAAGAASAPAQETAA